jgi:hypothetical protein
MFRIVSLPWVISISKAATFGLYYLRFYYATPTSRLIIKYTRVSGRASYASSYDFGQYMNLISLLYAGSYMAKIWDSIKLSNSGRLAFELV